MKKLMLIMAAAFAMVACQTDINEVGVVGGEVDVTFEVGTPTRAYSDGTTATVLQYAVYEGETELTALTRSVEDNNPDTINISKTVSFKLVTGNTYTVIFWAASPNAPYTVNFADKTMTIDYNGVESNNENLDAFYKRHTFTVNGAQTETIELRRPFAQLNIGTSDFEAAEKAGYTADESFVKVTKLGNVLNLWNDKVEGTDAEITFNYAAIPTTETFPVAGYEYLAMNYLLVDSEKEVVDIEFGYNDVDVNDAKTRIVGSVPVQRNYRTNIYGQLLTSDVDINVVIKPEYEEPAHELAALQNAALNGGTVTLTEDVVLTTPLQVLAAMTINLNGKTINNPAGYAIENYSELTIEGNGDLNGMGAIRSHGGKVTINGGTFTGTSNWSTGTYQHLLKAVNTEVVINGGTFDATIGGTNNAMINVSENSVVTINGGTFKNVNGVIPQFAPYMFTYEKNGKLVINGGEFYGGWRFNGETASTDIYGGTFTVSYDGQSFHAASTHVLTIYGGAFSLANGGKLNPANHLAAGLKTIEKDGLYYVVADTVDAVVADATELQAALAAGGEVVLADDVTYTSNKIENDAVINLNGNSFLPEGTINLNNNADLTMVGGDYVVNGTYGHVDVRPSSADGSTVVYENVHFTSNYINKTHGNSTDRLTSVVEVCAVATDAKTVIKFKNCTFDNGKVLIEGMSGKIGIVEAVFEGCTFNALTNSSPIDVMNYVTGTIEVKDCTFNLECTSGVASAIDVSPSSSTSVVLTATNNTFNAVAATPYTYDASKGETEAHNVKVNGTPANIKFISAYANTTVTETGTKKSGIAKL